MLRDIAAGCLTLALAACLWGCQASTETLQLSDLTPAERQYIDRFVTLERARAVALVEAERGAALLDSLAAAWGDSSLAVTRRNLPRLPDRMAALNELLARILNAERDSLLLAPEARRLLAPLPDPPPVPVTAD